ncbi:hypothetical protein C8R43DRAFT_700642 [Mycena crocata]|nr:hypothetical protein C8R43DRAFT_700642 [Mycena crocata]
MTPSTLSPRLPPELEREIFQVCASARPVTISKLMLVAWRVKDWVEPFLYRTIAIQYTAALEPYPIFTWPTLLSAVHSKPASFFHNSVRNLSLLLMGTSDATNAQQLLSACTGVANLTIMNFSVIAADLDGLAQTLIPLLSSLRPRRIHADLLPVLRTLKPAHPFFSQITHVELLREDSRISTAQYDTTWAQLSLIPHLTHLSFNNIGSTDTPLELLQTCQSLSVLVLLDPFPPLRPYLTLLTTDPRFVVMSCSARLHDWQLGIHAGLDYWTRAEAFVALRRSGELDAREYEIPEDASLGIARRMLH